MLAVPFISRSAARPQFNELPYIAALCIMCGMIEKELVAASTEPLILSLLAKGESYGYELIQEVKELSGDKIKFNRVVSIASCAGLRASKTRRQKTA